MLYQGGQATELTLTSVGADITCMEFPYVPGLYYVEIDFDPDEEGLVFFSYPNWLHFVDEEPQNGVIYTPGVFTFYCDELPSSSPRSGDLWVQGAGTGTECTLTVTQVG